MAACALASARARDGALTFVVAQEQNAMPPEMFYSASQEGLPKELLHCQDLDFLRAHALLALASLQDAKVAELHMYIGLFFTIVSINQWHDETRWPLELQPVEKEEFRRLVSLHTEQRMDSRLV